jgi:hypothetical protein
MILLNDPCHRRHYLEFEQLPDKIFPLEADPEWCNWQRQYIPVTPGYKWEYLDLKDAMWKEYTEPIHYLIESLYDMGSCHCLYRPGAPHCEGQLRAKMASRLRILKISGWAILFLECHYIMMLLRVRLSFQSKQNTQAHHDGT